MKIGIDVDGVVLDSETEFRIEAELYDILTLKRNSIINKIVGPDRMSKKANIYF